MQRNVSALSLFSRSFSLLPTSAPLTLPLSSLSLSLNLSPPFSHTAGFSELGKLKNLRVLDLGECCIDLPENEFFNFVLPHLKKLPKLEYINFSGNPIQTTIREFRYFAIFELPKLKYLNWELIAKEDRSFASDLAASGTWDNKNRSIASHSNSGATFTSSSRPSTPAEANGGALNERAIKHGTYAASRLEELLAAEEAKSSSTSSLTGDLDDLDKILDMVGGTSIAARPPAARAPAPSSSSSSSLAAPSTSSILDELDALLGTTTAPPLSQPGNRGSYVDTLSGILDDVSAPRVKTPSPSSSNCSLAATASKKAVDPLDELDSIIGSTKRTSSSGSLNRSSSPSLRTANNTTPPPPSRVTSVVDPLDDILNQLDGTTATEKSPAPKLSNRAVNKPRSTIFEDLESDIFALESDHARTQATPPPTTTPASSSSGANNTSPTTSATTATAASAIPAAVAKKPRPTSTAIAAMSNNSDLDILEQDILAISMSSLSGTKASSAASAASAALPSSTSSSLSARSVSPSLNNNNKPSPLNKTSSLDEILAQTTASPAIASPKPVALPGSGLAALANFTSAITTNQFDSLLDSFDSASAKALSTPPVVAVASSTTLQTTTNNPSSPAPTRSLQRGPRPSVTTPVAQKPVQNPCEIPAEALLYDFLLGRGIWGETFEGGWKNDADSKTTPVTLKRLFNTDFQPESVAKFREEVKDLLPLKHPNLVPLVGCSVRDSKVILWKGVHGAPLWGYLRNPNNVMTPRQVLHWARQLASAISYLHSQHVIHGGIKTSNIIIDKEQNLVTKDYAFMDYKDEIPLVDSDPRWLAPEVIVSRDTGYNEKVDVYAFGMVVYEMMMRESPFVTMRPSEVIDMLTYRIIRPECVPGVFPPVFIRLLSACWSHDPAERPPMEKVLKILESNPDNILGDYADMHLEMPAPKVAGSGRPTYNPLAPRPSEPPRPVNLPAAVGLSSASASAVSPKIVPKVASRPPAASVGTMHDTSTFVAPSAPSRPSLRIAKPVAIKPLQSEDLSLEVEQERKLAALLSKLADMLASGEPEQQSRAMNTLLEVVKDEKRINYVATKSLITRDLVELLRANPVDTITSWRYEFPTAFETIELIMKSTATLSATDSMARAFVKHGMMDTLVEFVSRGVDSLKILAGQAIAELCMTTEGRTAFRKAAGITALHAMLKNKNEFVSAQAAWTLSTALDDELNQEDFVTAGGLDTLIATLAIPNAALKLRTLDALSNFWNNERAREQLVNASIKDKFLQMLASNGSMLQRTAMRGIGKFSRYPTFQPTEIECLKILKVSMEVAQSPDSMIRERLNAINICDNLTKDKTMMTNFRDMGGLSMMTKCISDAHPEIRCSAIHVLQRALGDDRSRDAIIALGAVAPLISQLASANVQVRIRAMGAVDVLRKFPRGQSAIIANAGVSRVVSIVAFSEDPNESCLALQLMDVFSDDPDHKEDVREAGGLTAVLDHLPTYNPECRLLACLNIGHLCSTEKNRQALAEQKGISAYITTALGLWRVAAHNFSQANGSDEPFIPEERLKSVINSLLNTLYNLSQIAEFRPALRDADAAQFACDMLGSHSDDIQVHAVRALTGLATDPKNKVIIRTGASKRLKGFALTSSNSLVAQSSNQVLVLIDAK